MQDLPDLPLPEGLRAGYVDDINGLRMHVLEAGPRDSSRPLVLLLHGFPELAYSWRKVMTPLADAGFRVVAPDQRGYGRTTGWSDDYDADLSPFRPLNLVRDAVGLAAALGYREVAAVIGHDYGSSVAAWCALLRGDVFRKVTMMSAPFGGPPALPLATADGAPQPAPVDIDRDLAALDPPRRHYHRYYATRAANADMLLAPRGLHAFLRAYYHHKSADWPRNRPFPLKAWSAAELAKLPTYYAMRLEQDMAATVAAEMPSPDAIAACRWLPDSELAVYVREYGRTGFQGGLNWYRTRFEPRLLAEGQVFAGRTIDVPACFIAGASDWGIHQRAGDFDRMRTSVCTDMRGVHLIEGAGHWVQQEQPDEVSRLLIDFLRL